MSTIKSSAEDLILNADGASSEVKIQQNGTTAIVVNSSEQIGIGDTSPSRTVSIKNASQAEIGFKTGSVANGALIYYNDSENKLLLRAQESGDHIEFQTGGTSVRMTIDGSGRVTMPNQPAFHTFGSQSYTARSNPVDYTSVQFNIGSHYSNSTYRFTAPVAGTYHFTAGAIAAYENVAAGGIMIVKNGSTRMARSYQATQQRSRNCAVTLSLSANDYIEVWCEGQTTLYLGDGYGYFSGHLIG